MSSVDNRIVNMQFNNKQFQSGAADSVQALDELEKTIDGMGTSGGLADMGGEIDQITGRFSALQIAGVAALATIASTATSAALSLGRDLLGSVTNLLGVSGFSRAIDLQQAAFQFRGLGLDVKEVMDNATEAVDGTSFALNEAATVATSFAGSGVKAGEDMTVALRGVAGVAAQTGSSFSEIGQIFAGISGIGKVTTQDFNQFGVRGLNITKALAKQIGVARGEIAGMLSDGSISFHTFALAMDNAFGKNAAKANRTFTGALANMKTAVTRIGAGFFSELLKPAGDIFNAMSEAIKEVQTALGPDGLNLTGGFGKVAESVSGVIVQFIQAIKIGKLIGPIIEGIGNIFAPLVAIFKAVGEAWVTVFPAKQNKGLATIYKASKLFEFLTRPLQWLAEQIPKITPLFVALFSAIQFGVNVITALAGKLGDFVAIAQEVGGNIIGGIIEGFDGSAIESSIVKLATSIIDWIKEALGIHSPADTMVPIGESIIQGIAKGITESVQFLLEAMGKMAMAVIDGFKNAFGDMDATDWAALFNAVLTGGLLLAITSFVRSIKGITDKLGGVLTTINAPFQLLTDSLKVMQSQVRATMILNIAIAVGVLTASIVILSQLDPKKVAIGLGFLAGELALMVGVMVTLGKINPEQIAASGAAILLISTAMLVLSGAIAVLSAIDPNKLANGLTAMALALALMVGSVSALSGFGPEVLAAGGALFILASAMVILSVALIALSAVNPEKMSHALTTMAVGIAEMTAAIAILSALGPEALAGAGALYIVAAAMLALSASIVILAAINPSKMSHALVTMGVGLAEMAAAIAILSAAGPETLAAAGAIYIVSVAMIALAEALKIMGGVGAEKMSQGLTTMAVALGIFLAAAAIAAIGPIAVGLGVLALSMLAFGAGVALLGAGLLAAATAFTIFTTVFGAGLGVVVAGIGTLLTLLPTMAQQLAASIVVFVKAIASAAPELRKAFGEIIKAMLGTIRDSIPQAKKLINDLLDAIVDILNKNIDRWRKLFETLVRAGLQAIRNLTPNFVNTGIAIVLAFLNGLTDRMPKLVDAGVAVVVAFIRGIGNNAEKLVNAATKTIKQFVDALPPAVHDLTEEISGVGFDIAIAIATGLYDGLVTKGVDLAIEAAKKLASALPEWMQKILGIASPSKVAIWWGEMIVKGLVIGITDHIKDAVGAAVQLANAVVAAGDKVVAKAQRESRKAQIAAAKKQARADLSDRIAKEAEKAARKSPKNKELQKAATEARKIADAQQKAADAAQKRADAESQKVQDVQAFRDADKQGKGDILTDRANELADKAIKKLAEANAAAQAAEKATGKERERLKKEAKEDAEVAKRLAKASKDAQQRASEFYAKAVRDRIQAIVTARKEDAKQEREQKKFDAATDEQKIEILQSRAEAAQKRANAAQKQSEALVKQARKLAKTDAAQAQKLLDKSERLAQKAQDSADEAKQALQDEDAIKNQDSTGTGTTSTLTISKSILEQAASAVDRMTQSLLQAEEAAMSATPVVQFVQTNNSPEALSDSVIYRQTKNLLSTAEVKMAGT